MKFIALLLISSAAAQAPCDQPAYDGCIQAIKDFTAGTCTPLAGNLTLQIQCQCYAYVKQAVCFTAPCIAANPTIAAESNGNKANVGSICASVKLNPAALPNPAPWISGSANPVATPAATSSTSGTLPNASPSVTATGTASSKTSSALGMEISALCLVFLISYIPY